MPPMPESLCPCHDGDDKPLLRLRDGRWEYGKAMDEWPTVQKVELRFVMTNVALQRWDVMNAIKCTGEAMDLLMTAEEGGVRFPYHESRYTTCPLDTSDGPKYIDSAPRSEAWRWPSRRAACTCTSARHPKACTWAREAGLRLRIKNGDWLFLDGHGKRLRIQIAVCMHSRTASLITTLVTR